MVTLQELFHEAAIDWRQAWWPHHQRVLVKSYEDLKRWVEVARASKKRLVEYLVSAGIDTSTNEMRRWLEAVGQGCLNVATKAEVENDLPVLVVYTAGRTCRWRPSTGWDPYKPIQ